MALCAVVASCSQDEIGVKQDDTLPAGNFPLRFTASVDGMVSRAEDTDSWSVGDIIRVRIGTYPWTGQYELNADGSVRDAIDALAWPHSDDFVHAWFPYLENGTAVSIQDQSKGYHDFNFMEAHTETSMNYTQIVNLKFKHQMAKVQCVLSKGDGITDEDLETAKVTYYGFTTAVFSESGLSSEGDGEITPTSDFAALLLPKDMSGKPFITVNLTVKVNGVSIPKSHTFIPETGQVDLKAGKAYTFKMIVQKDRLITQTISGEWIDDNGPKDADQVPRRVNLNITEIQNLNPTFSGNVTPVPDATNPEYLLVKGKEFTISYKVNDSDAMKGIIPLIDDADKVKMNCLKSGDDYTFTYKLLTDSEISLQYTDYVQVGDIYYSDGTWSRGLTEGKYPVGIVFKTSASGTAPQNKPDSIDKPQNYGWEPDRAIRGYVVALKNASTKKGRWGITAADKQGRYAYYISNQEESLEVNTIYSGYVNTDILINGKQVEETRTKYNETNVSTGAGFWAFKVAVEYKPDNIPDGTPTPYLEESESSGWYLPSIRQLTDISTIFTFNKYIEEAGGDPFAYYQEQFWSSSEFPSGKDQSNNAYTRLIVLESTGNLGKNVTNAYVRSVLTF